ncbi:MAG: 16S rRNA (guanine(966)-N(2))-methyltransferase RsmD [Alphaproteobacteria bacterium]|nr:16S rRNA (guanine(966)-N(2))-methyltransferase RsmD [Alphaproteobacteria bacterium]
MRINAGIWRGRRLAAPPDRSVRPTSERARIALFNILAHGAAFRSGDVPLPQGACVVELFAGTGALGLEALSRGAAHAIFIEQDRASAALLSRNIAALACEDRATLLVRDALDPGPPPMRCQLALLDPPYGSGLGAKALAALRQRGWLAPGAIAVLEVGAREAFAPPEGFELLDERAHGAARLVFLRRAD